MVDVEECPLCTFKKDFFAPFDRVMEIDDRVIHEGPQFFSGRDITFVDLPKTDGLRAERLKDSIVLDYFGLQFLREHNRLHQVGYPQTRARGFVSIGRSYPTFRGSDPTPTQFALLVKHAVVRQNKVSAIANEQVLVDLNPHLAQTVDLGDQRHRIDNNAVSNHADFTAPEDSGRDQMQNIFRAAMNDGVPGIVTALAADNDVGLGGKHIYDLALALVAPLHSN